MIETRIDSSVNNGSIILSPNCSSSWDMNLLLIITSLLLAATVSIPFAFMGYWLILPFSGLEVITLTAVLYVCLWNNNRRQVITFSDDLVVVQSGTKKPVYEHRFQRYWTKIFIRKPQFRGHEKRIFIRSQDHEIELGTFLNKKDREALIKTLYQLIYAR